MDWSARHLEFASFSRYVSSSSVGARFVFHQLQQDKSVQKVCKPMLLKVKIDTLPIPEHTCYFCAIPLGYCPCHTRHARSTGFLDTDLTPQESYRSNACFP